MWLAREWEFRQSLGLSLAVLFDRTHSLAAVEKLLAYPEVEARRAYAESLSAVLFLQELSGRLIWADVLKETMSCDFFFEAVEPGAGPDGGTISAQDETERRTAHLNFVYGFQYLWVFIFGRPMTEMSELAERIDYFQSVKQRANSPRSQS